MTLIEQIAYYLHENNIGIFDPTGVTGNIFLATVPDKPDQCIAIFPAGGTQSNGKLAYDNPNIQIWIRGSNNPITGMVKAQDIYDLLHGFYQSRFYPDGNYILDCLGQQSAPISIGKDSQGRFEFSLNFKIEHQNINRRNS
ncbi:MAG: hypothetical protein CVU90_02020 [Firmicutes bacterium HGW-Firmicutes-15]|nr:MAG: hypothetical protein CVU90_02020 [Firmicutes bacterium HGW-Firmicutes-15]